MDKCALLFVSWQPLQRLQRESETFSPDAQNARLWKSLQKGSTIFEIFQSLMLRCLGENYFGFRILERFIRLQPLLSKYLFDKATSSKCKCTFTTLNKGTFPKIALISVNIKCIIIKLLKRKNHLKQELIASGTFLGTIGPTASSLCPPSVLLV